MQLEKHPVWDFPDLNSFKENFLGELFLKPEVPKKIKEQAVIIDKLLLHSYYEYSFIEIAILQGVILLEKALKMRFEELNIPLKKRAVLNDVIQVALDNNMFEDNNQDTYDVYRKIRNKKVHEVSNDIGGLFYIRGTYRIFNFINDLYEDPALRIKRWEATKKLNEDFEATFNKGFIFNDGEKRWIGYKVIPVFINNKTNEFTLQLSISKIYDPKFFSTNKGLPNNVTIIKVKNWKLHNEEFIAHSEEGEFRITQLTDETNSNKYIEWFNNPLIANERMVINFVSYDRHGYEASLKEFYKLH